MHALRLGSSLFSVLAVSVAAQLPSTGSSLPKAHLPQPTPIWFTFDDYPRDAVIQRMQGSVGFRLILGTDGLVRDCIIAQSSGHDLLDQETCSILRRRAKLDPPRNDAGQPQVSQYDGRITWHLPSGPVKLPEPYRTVGIEVRNAQPVCWIDWNGARRDLSAKVCARMVSELPETTAFPVKLNVSATPKELGF
ncbi:energy transducer TonB [Sphingomonas crusticola]|uniref:energy transducer TonB n=1 Tax=Sphingomonas crusticola TaxID=1697973 RepID=UPI000E23A668